MIAAIWRMSWVFNVLYFGGDEVRVPFGISRGRVLKEGKGSASPRAQHVADNREELLG
jgi:hypothetical protein